MCADRLHVFDLVKFQHLGVEFVFVYGVDNIAIRICDPAFIGLLKEQGGDCGVKVVPKDFPAERVGVVALRNGAPSVVEYSGACVQLLPPFSLSLSLSLSLCDDLDLTRLFVNYVNRVGQAHGGEGRVRWAAAVQHGQHLHPLVHHRVSGELSCDSALSRYYCCCWS